MRRYISLAAGILGCTLAAGQAAAATVTTLYSDFESPVFSTTANGGTGNITNDPNATGQGGWGGWNAILDEANACCLRARVTDERAHTGTQSMLTTRDTRTIDKALDAEGTAPYNTNSSGEYPFHTGGFTLFPGYDWWVQAFVWINPGGSARMVLRSGLGGCPLLDIGNFGGGNDPGEPYANTCLAQTGNQPNLGSQAYGQWLLLEMVHTVAMGQAMEFRISGAGIDWSTSLGPYSGPGSGNPAYLGLAGDAFWDDVRAGYGDAPVSTVPVPGAGWLLGSALGAIGVVRRKVRA